MGETSDRDTNQSPGTHGKSLQQQFEGERYEELAALVRSRFEGSKAFSSRELEKDPKRRENLIGIAAKIVYQLDLKTRVDELTNLLKQEPFKEMMRITLEMARDQRLYAFFLYSDLNGFKRYNDTHGHDRGNEVLKINATILRRSLREYDVISRPYGEPKNDLAGHPHGDESYGLFVSQVANAGERVLSRLAVNIATPRPFVARLNAERRKAGKEEEPIEIPEGFETISLSTGMRIIKPDEIPEAIDTGFVNRLISEAEIAMYGAKALSRGNTVPVIRESVGDAKFFIFQNIMHVCQWLPGLKMPAPSLVNGAR